MKNDLQSHRVQGVESVPFHLVHRNYRTESSKNEENRNMFQKMENKINIRRKVNELEINNLPGKKFNK